MFKNLGTVVYKARWLIIVLALALTGAAAYLDTGVFSRLDTGGFTSRQFESFRAQQEITDHFGSSQSLIVLFSSQDMNAASVPFQKAVAQALAPVRGDASIDAITDYYHTHAPALVSYDGKSTYAVIKLKGDQQDGLAAAKRLRPKITSSTLTVHTGGAPAINADFNNQIAGDLGKAETLSFAILAVLLVVVFRSFVAALLPLLLGAFGILGAFLVVRGLTYVTTISQYAINVITLAGLGLSIDYSLFMVSRYREELRHLPPREALLATMGSAGRTVFFSGLTVILSLCGMLVFPINFLRSMGLGASAAVAVAVMGSLTILPAVLAVLGIRVNALSFGRVKRDYQALKRGEAVSPEQRTIWYRVARWAMRHPALTIGLVLIPLIFMGQYFLKASFSSADYRSLPAAASSRQVQDALSHDFPGQLGASPVQVVIHTPTAKPDPAALASYTKTLTALPGATSVQIAQQAQGYTVANVYYVAQYDQPLARDVVTAARAATPPAGWTVHVGGQTAMLDDLLTSIGHYAVWAGLLVASALVILFIIMFRSLVIPFEALLVNVLSLTATFGILVWIFQEGHLSRWLDFQPVGAIDATQPVLIFGIAFGLSMDYSVFLLSRIKEQFDKSGRVEESIAEGVQKTGTIITSAAVLFIVVVGAFATSKIQLIKQVGLGLGLAVFIDAFLIRMLLVPAMMRLLGRFNWWWPGRKLPDAPRTSEIPTATPAPEQELTIGTD